MHRTGKTPVFGIDSAEEGIFVSSVEYTPTCETYEQLDHHGEVIGVAQFKQRVELSMTGEVPYNASGSSSAPTFAMGGTIALNNACPASCWLGGTAPEATTTIITGMPVTRSREGAQELNVTATIYPFGTAA